MTEYFISKEFAGFKERKILFKGVVLTSFTAVTPWQAGEVHEGVEEVEEGPGDDNDVVNILKEHHHYRRVAITLGIKIKRKCWSFNKMSYLKYRG